MTGRHFDAEAFAAELRPAVTAAGGVRAAAEDSGVSASTVSRACGGWPDLSHENWLRLTAWVEARRARAA